MNAMQVSANQTGGLPLGIAPSHPRPLLVLWCPGASSLLSSSIDRGEGRETEAPAGARRMRPYPLRRAQSMRHSTSFRSMSALMQRQRRRYRRARRLRRAGLGVLGVGLLLIGWWGALRLDHRPARSTAAVPPAGVTSPHPDVVTSPHSQVVTSPHPQVTTLTLRAPVGPLQGLTAPVQTLAIHDRALQTLPPLSATLTALDLSGTGVTSLTALAQLPQLQEVHVAGTRLTSLAGLEQLPQLTTLQVAHTGPTSLAGVEQLPQLTTLDLSDTGRLGLPAFAGSPPSAHALSLLRGCALWGVPRTMMPGSILRAAQPWIQAPCTAASQHQPGLSHGDTCYSLSSSFPH